MKKVYIIHGWEGTSKFSWVPHIANSLRELGFEVVAPDMPNTDAPDMKEWVNYLKDIAQEIDEETVFIGHSIGCQTIMRFLEKQDKKVNGCIFVAGWFDLINLSDEESKEIAKPWLETPIDFKKIKQNTGKITTILGDKDQWVPYEKTKEKFENNLGAKIITMEGRGHLDGENEKLPELVEIFKKEFIN